MGFFAPIVAPAAAQQLERLHVRQFAMSADPVTLHVGETMRLRIFTRVDENVGRLDNVTLPDLSGFESLGDERQCSTAFHGSQCVETITLTPTIAGDRTIAGATLDVVDPRGRAVQYTSNAVTVHVASDAQNYFLSALLQSLVQPLLILLAVAALGYGVLWGWGRRVRAVPPPQPVAPPAPAAPPPPPPLDPLLERLAAAPTRPNLLAVRAELRRRIGAREEETLADLVARRATGGNNDLTEALRAVEYAAFADDERLPAGIERALPPLRRLAAQSVGAAS
jgi:hypothetical protein